MSNTRICWSRPELLMVGVEARRLLRSGHSPHHQQLYRDAQLVLPSERRRAINYSSDGVQIENADKRAREKIRNEKKLKAAPQKSVKPRQEPQSKTAQRAPGSVFEIMIEDAVTRACHERFDRLEKQFAAVLAKIDHSHNSLMRYWEPSSSSSANELISVASSIVAEQTGVLV